MHLITTTKPVDMGKRFGALLPGKWIVEDKNAFEIGLLAERGTVKAEAADAVIVEDPLNILIVRSGAIGDLLFLGPCIAPIKAKFPRAQVHLACFPVHQELFELDSPFDGIVNYPVAYEKSLDFDMIITLEGVMELADNRHATDAFADALGVTVSDYAIRYKVSPLEKEFAAGLDALKTTRPKLGVQMKCSTSNRDYPLGQWLQIILGLEQRGWAVFLFGLKGQLPELPPQFRRPDIHDFSQLGLNFRETAAVIECMDAFVGVDSSLLHLCDAVKVPAIGLFAAFNWRHRTAKAPLTEAITGMGDCAPCNWHSKNGQNFPPHMPCAKTGVCSVIAGIHPDRVIRKVDSLRPALIHA